LETKTIKLTLIPNVERYRGYIGTMKEAVFSLEMKYATAVLRSCPLDT